MKTTLPTYKQYYILFWFLITAINGYSQTYNTPNTYTIKVPAGVTSLTAEAWGAGGAGSRMTSGNRGGGGGGGAYAKTSSISVNAFTDYIVTVGTGGLSTSSPTNGGNSSFDTFVIAEGGKSANSNSTTGGSGGLATNSTGITKYNGGNGASGGVTYSGGGGGGAGSANNGSNGTNSTSTNGGAGGATGGGNGGNGVSGNTDGNNGATYGGGGSGATRTSGTKTGGNGAGGQVKLTYTCPTYNLSSTTVKATNPGSTSTITLISSAANLPTGIYTITYNLSAPNNSTGNTATMTVTTAGTGSFNTINLTNTGTTTITITNIASGTGNTCSNAISSNHTANITVANKPIINVQSNSTTIANGDTTPSITDNTDFGSTQITNEPLYKTFTIYNTGTVNLNLTGSPTIAISGTNSADFTVTILPNTTISASSNTTFQIRFNPSSAGLKTATITISNNDSNENPYVFSIQGTGRQTFYDSDGDGILDNIDIDDDNDGILDTTEENNCKAVNGYAVNYKFLDETFGAGSRTTINTTYNATTSYCFQPDYTTSTSCDGGTNSPSLNDGKYTVGSSAQIATWANNYWYMGTDHTGDTNGRMALFNASYTPGTFYTAEITGALPGIPITYSFWVLNLDRSDAPGIATRLRPNIKVEFKDLNDNVLATINTGAIQPTTAGNLAGDWYQFTSNLTLSVSAFKVIFTNNETGGTGNDLALDDISITQTLCDRDNDGIADVFDLDADNDGIEDVIEAGLGNLTNGKGKFDETIWVDTNGNGLHDSAESIAALPALDSDGDGIPNYLDLDSDNDSLFDVDEAGTGNSNAVAGYINGDGDINGDGVGDGPESEAFRYKDVNGDGVPEFFGDGILDIYDYGTGSDQYGNLGQGTANLTFPAATYLKDTDGDGIPDYLDLKSDGINWDITKNILIYDYKTLDANNDGIIDGTADADKDGIIDSFDTNTAQFGSPRDLHTKLYLDFDGRNDYAESTSILGNLSSASLMSWINLNPSFSNKGVIVGQENFLIQINSSKQLEVSINGSTYTYNTTLNVSQWYHVATVYDGATVKLYLNGNLVLTQAKTGAISTDTTLLTLGKNPNASSNFFMGKIDEVRVFNTALSDSFLQRMVYQEIQDFGGEIRGEIVPKNIATSPESLPFSNLLRYYRMDNYKDDIIDDLTTPAIDVTGTKIYNHKNIYIQQAPMPFLTERDGDFSTAVNSPTKEIRGLDIMENDWSIVKVQHDITETSNNIDLGMLVDSGKIIIMNNDTKIQNDWYLKLDGKIDLEGKSQLVQTSESDLDPTSSGYIERDQQGQANKFNYNYWSSPVCLINSLINNKDYTVNDVMKDGTTSIPQNINWVSGYDGSNTTPISIARYWLYKFDNYSNVYANWVRIGETGTIRVGQGYTLKGTNASTNTQNYTFVGKPNNGTISSNTVSSNQLLLAGNPYPSALDAIAFINDNSDSIDGTLYFWEQYTTNNTHVLRDYQGGYAQRNLTGGVPPTSAGVDYISGLGSSTRGIPNQFIPVGQAFFVIGKSGSGGNVVFKNSQRGFHKEDETNVSNIMYKMVSNSKSNKNWKNNNNDSIPKENKFMKVRLGYNSTNNYHRQILLGFMNEKATFNFDYGYDGFNLDNFPNDMYFINSNSQLIIQGVGFFESNTSFPIGVKVTTSGKVSFMLDGIENFDANQKFYIHDNENDAYHDITTESYDVILPKGTNNSRFSLRFAKNSSLSTTESQSIENLIIVKYDKLNKKVTIENATTDVTISKVHLYDINGKSIQTWEIKNQFEKKIELPITQISSGVYIVVIETSKGKMSKKIIL